MINLLVKVAQKPTPKIVKFPELNASDFPKKIVRQVTNYLSKIRSEMSETVEQKEVTSLLTSVGIDVTSVDLDEDLKRRFSTLSRNKTTPSIAVDDIENVSPFVFYSKERNTYFAVIDDCKVKVKSDKEMAQYYFRSVVPKTYYALVSLSYLQLLADSGHQFMDHHPGSALTAVKWYILDNYKVALNASLNAQYGRDSQRTIATIRDDKKRLDEELNKSTLFNQLGFRKCEIDTQTYSGEAFDYAAFQKLEKDWLNLCNKLPRTTKQPELKFRRLGKHKATGLYVPALNILAVDVRDSSAFVHEYGHYLDFTSQKGTQLSLSLGFTPIVEQYSNNLKQLCLEYPSLAKDIEKKWQYYTTPTEVFARGFELWVHFRIVKNELTKTTIAYNKGLEYRAMKPLFSELIEIFSILFGDYQSSQEQLLPQVAEAKTTYWVSTRENLEPTNRGMQLTLF